MPPPYVRTRRINSLVSWVREGRHTAWLRGRELRRQPARRERRLGPSDGAIESFKSNKWSETIYFTESFTKSGVSSWEGQGGGEGLGVPSELPMHANPILCKLKKVTNVEHART